MLEISFSKAKSEEDFIIHFFDKKANKRTSHKKIYIVFKNKYEFFNYFKITGNDKKILNEIFPEEYLTFFDNNSSLDISIINLINVVENIKIKENDIDEEDF